MLIITAYDFKSKEKLNECDEKVINEPARSV